MSEGQDDLTREVAETRASVEALEGRYQARIDELLGINDTMQTKIDELQALLDAGPVSPSVQAAVDELNQLQTDMNAKLQAPVTADPAEAAILDAASKQTDPARATADPGNDPNTQTDPEPA